MQPRTSRASDLDHPPDLLVIVMDCVRARDFPGGPAGVPMPFVERLMRDSISFPRAVSVAPWTLPSHASLFTGLYPWEHGCHGRGSLVLDPRFDRLASVLRSRGYRTASFSGNPIISPYYGLADGFDVSEWGEWWEQVDRSRSTPSHSLRSAPGEPRPEVPELSFRDRAGRAIKTMMTRYPATLSLTDATVRRIVDPARADPASMNPWIETDVARWLRDQPRDAPTFVFVNTIDAHEPYLLDPADAPTLAEWWREMRIPQDVLALLASEQPPPERDLARLHALYQRAIRRLDRRLERLVRIYQDAGRWERCLFALTSDHGQGFGEHGMVWHGVRTDEEMLRVPLVVRLPENDLGGSRAVGWGSPLDIAPTVLAEVGAPSAITTSGVALRSLVAQERAEPLLAAGDGTEWNRPFLASLSPQRRIELNQFSVAAYLGRSKVVVDAVSGQVRTFGLPDDPASETLLPKAPGPELDPLISAAKTAAEALMRPPGVGVSNVVDQRLRSWGYG